MERGKIPQTEVITIQNRKKEQFVWQMTQN